MSAGDDDETRVFRVTVRGRFNDLTENARAFLTRSLAEHDVFNSAFTPEGVFSYDAGLAFFNIRYELRASGADAAEFVELEALEEAERFLATLGIGATRLRANVVDMSAMMSSVRRRHR